MHNDRLSRISFAVLIIVGTVIVADDASAQSRRRDRDDLTAQQLAARAEKAESALIQELVQVAEDYYKLGQLEKSRDMLQRVMRISRDVPGVKEKIDEINRELVEANGAVIELDASGSWGEAIAIVMPGKPYRIEATGTYEVEFSRRIDVSGLSTEDAQRDHVGGAPFGSLIGIIVSDGQPGDPFVVKTGIEETAKKGGQLYLRVNVPADATCDGKVRLQLSGQIQVNPRRVKKDK